MSSAKSLHKRQVRGLHTREINDWCGVPLKGTYLLESRIPNASGENTFPLILIPGAWDPELGEFSEGLILEALKSGAVTSVYELHYRGEGQDGALVPESVVEDLVAMSMQPEMQPMFVALCAGAPLILEALLVAITRNPSPPVRGVLLIGAGIPGYLNRVGRAVALSVSHEKMVSVAKYLIYAGHPHTPPNYHRLEKWFRNSQFRVAMDNADVSRPMEDRFPVAVESLYFKMDIISREGRARLRRVFGVPHREDRLPGVHRALRNCPVADKKILEITQEIARPGSLSVSAAS